MSVTYTISLSDAENKALGAVALDQQDWIDNVVHERCRLAIEEIVASEVNKIISSGGTVSGTKEDIVNTANIESAAERRARIEAERDAE